MNRATRLQKAGIPVQFSDNTIPFSVWVDPITIRSTFALNPGNYGELEERMQLLEKYAGSQTKKPGLLIGASWVSSTLDIVQVLKRSMRENEIQLAPLARAYASEEMRSGFRNWMQSSRNNLEFEGMAGIAKLGVQPADVQVLVEKVLNLEDIAKGTFALGVLAQHNQLQAVVESGALDAAMDANETIACAVGFVLNGDLQQLETLLSSFNNWAEGVGICYMLMTSISSHASSEALELLLNASLEQENVDVMTYLVWAIGRCVRTLGFDAAKMLLEFCRDNFSNKRGSVCFLLNAVLRYSPTAEEKDILLAVLHEIETEDRRLSHALGRVQDMWNSTYVAVNWLYETGYGCIMDFYEPTENIMPVEIRNAVASVPEVEPFSIMSFLSNVQQEPMFAAMITSRLLFYHPEYISAFSQWMRSDVSDDTKKGVAMTLLTTTIEHSVPPVFLRCCVDVGVGGPVEEDDGIFGELISYYDAWRLRGTALQLLLKGSKSLRAQTARYFAGKTQTDTSDDNFNILFQTGIVQPQTISLPASSNSVLMSAKLPYDTQGLLQELQSVTEKERNDFWAVLSQWFANADRDEMLALAREVSLWNSYEKKQVQQLVLNLGNHQYGSQKEVAAVIAYTVGKDMLLGEMGAKIESLLLSLVNDSNSNIVEEATKACAILELKAVVINQETLRHNILNGGEDLDAWIERLFTFFDEANDTNALRSLSRFKNIWEIAGIDRVEPKWFAWAGSDNWQHREMAGILVATYGDVLLAGAKGQEIADRVQALAGDDDGDVQREARLACDVHAITYTP